MEAPVWQPDGDQPHWFLIAVAGICLIACLYFGYRSQQEWRRLQACPMLRALSQSSCVSFMNDTNFLRVLSGLKARKARRAVSEGSRKAFEEALDNTRDPIPDQGLRRRSQRS